MKSGGVLEFTKLRYCVIFFLLDTGVSWWSAPQHDSWWRRWPNKSRPWEIPTVPGRYVSSLKKHFTIIIRFFIKAVKKFPYNHYISCRPLDSSKYFAGLFCVDVHLVSPCYLMAMKLSNFRTLFYARRILTLNIQINALFSNRKCT